VIAPETPLSEGSSGFITLFPDTAMPTISPLCRPQRFLGLALLTALPILPALLTSCASVQQLAQSSNLMPTARIAGVSLDSFSFDGVNMLFDLAISGATPAAATLSAVDWQLDFAGTRFLTGSTQENLVVTSGKETHLRIPATIGFSELFNTVTSLASADELPYRFQANLGIDVPVLGRVALPVSKSGALPAVHTPKISLDALDLQNLSIRGADLALRLNVDNPNAFGLAMQSLNYTMGLAGSSVASGTTRSSADFPSHGKGSIELPLHLDFLSAGRALFSALSGDQIDCSLNGQMDLGSTLPELTSLQLPFNAEERIPILGK
jgi:LEA14-like dessication related protein